MKKIFATAAIALFMMTSCSDDDSSSNNNNNNNPDAVLLKKTIETYSDGSTVTSQYQYDGNKITKIIGDDGLTTNLTYNDDKLSKIENMLDGVLIQKNTYAYNSAGKLSTSIVYYYEDGEPYAIKTLYTHNSNGTISTEVYSGDLNTQTILEEEGVYTLNNGNITSYVTDEYTSTYTYDSKNSPTKNSFADNVINLESGYGGVNNIVSYTNNDWDEQYNTTYSYNADNYPVSSEEDFDGEITTTEYFYE